MKNKAVVVLNQFALPTSRAGGTRHVELFERLPGWDATVIAGSRHYFDQEAVPSEGSLVTVPVTRYNGNGLGRVVNWGSYCVGALVRGLLCRGTKVVYGSSPHLGAGLVARAVSWLKRVPFVLEVRDLWPEMLVTAGALEKGSKTHKVLEAIEVFLYQQADAIVVLAEGSAPAICAHGISPDKIRFIPNGADPDSFSVSQDRDELRAKHGISGFTVVYAGAHGPANGLHLVLDAAKNLADDHPEVHFVLYGDGVLKSELVEAAERDGVRNVEFRDPVSKDLIPEIFAASDAGLHCLADMELFKTGVSPNKLYDYMAAGLPALTNTGGDTAALVERSRAGVAVESEKISDGVARLLGMSQEDRAELGVNGRAFIEQERSRSAMSRRVEELLDSLHP